MKKTIKLFGTQIRRIYVIALVLVTGLSACSGKKEGGSSIINAADGGGSSSAATAVPASLDENSATVVVVTPAIYLRMSQCTIAEINSFPQIGVVVEDNENVKRDWEIIKKAYNITINEQVTDSETIGVIIALSYGNPSSGAIIVASCMTMDEGSEENVISYSYLRQRWVYLLEDTKRLLPGQAKAQAMLALWG